MQKFTIRLLDSSNNVRAENTVQVADAQVWEIISDIAVHFGEPGDKIVVTDESGAMLARLGVNTARLEDRAA